MTPPIDHSSDTPLERLQQRLGYRFEQQGLLLRALTHRSFGADHNERLEFLGDAVLGLGVSSLLYERFSGSDEGDLTRVRAHLVREESLHRVAVQLGLPDVLRLSEAEARAGGSQRPSILADTLEALLGAVYLEGGFPAAARVLQRLVGETISSAEVTSFGKDAKTELQEWLQGRRLPVPAYRIKSTRGQAHAQTFEVNCEVTTLGLTETGEGRSRRQAEQEAARKMLASLRESDEPGSPLRS